MHGSETPINDAEADSADEVWVDAVSNSAVQIRGSERLTYVFTPPGFSTPMAPWSHTQGMVSSGLRAFQTKIQKVAEVPLIS